MFNLFNKKNPKCPLADDTREWMEHAFLWLRDEFGDDVIKYKKILLPDFDNFPIVYDGSHQSVIDTLNIVAKQMDVNPDEINLEFYSEGISEIGAGGIGGNIIYIKHEKETKLSSGKYYGKKEDGNYHISLEGENLKDPIGLVATLAHEIAHIKLLGESRIENNNEPLTDVTTIIFGLGIFSGNSAFRVATNFEKWEYKKLGYLTQIQWGYALAIHAHLREEINPSWTKFLSETVKGNFKRSALYINANKERILQYPEL